MQKLEIKRTEYSPGILLDNANKIISISGNSYPEDSFEFYKPVFAWINEFLQSCSVGDNIKVELDLNYMNSSSLKSYYDLLNILNTNKEKGISFEIKWSFWKDNDTAKEAGEDFQLDFDSLNIKLHEKSSS